MRKIRRKTHTGVMFTVMTFVIAFFALNWFFGLELGDVESATVEELSRAFDRLSIHQRADVVHRAVVSNRHPDFRRFFGIFSKFRPSNR